MNDDDRKSYGMLWGIVNAILILVFFALVATSPNCRITVQESDDR